MTCPHISKPGYTLIEIMLVVSLVAVLAAFMLTGTDSSARDSLNSLAQVIQTDLAYARSLAVANATEYKVSFDTANGQYTLVHVGSDSNWDNLPSSPFHPRSASNLAQTVSIDELPHLGGSVEILGVYTEAADETLTAVDGVTFGTIGETVDRAETTVIWLAAGLDTELRYQSIRVNAVTGLVDITELTGDRPEIESDSPSAYSSPVEAVL